ncbi:hypothetical protein PGTUg99_000578 [Puccinia graminis f. sp. tritici]|uniref:Uncharacterized protein n=2 Tax=Puccinia graminis f. sp. tritici TaxID=56615 RepID=E3KVR1_PUCGT|nr:uncharacterized protein PGTG_14485 [Puccinia graminis f. sp. tritici CRL 75-36-700-3]EFP88401.2 hypothetical protein PGTG_14485 [Puccinia graminis f. sp. tritici CRL 75-36-700-3]KAA1079907.1 hypothetical protein PGTUg99_000578 [Puccinia graminis f. sp. tritici]
MSNPPKKKRLAPVPIIWTVSPEGISSNIGQRNKDASKTYRALDQDALDLYKGNDDDEWIDADSTEDPNIEERSQFDLRRQSTKKLLANLKELSDGLGLEGFLVIADQDHRQPYFFQGGSFLLDLFLRGLIDKGDAISRFAIWTAGTKSRKNPAVNLPAPVVSTVCKVFEVKNSPGSNLVQTINEKSSTNPSLDVSKDNTPEFLDSDKQYKGRPGNRYVCQGSLTENHTYITEKLKEIYSKAIGITKSTTHWPGTNTQYKLKKKDLMLSIADNPVQLSATHFSQTIKKISLPDTWVVLRGLKNNWISLVPFVEPENPAPINIDEANSTNSNN